MDCTDGTLMFAATWAGVLIAVVLLLLARWYLKRGEVLLSEVERLNREWKAEVEPVVRVLRLIAADHGGRG